MPEATTVFTAVDTQDLDTFTALFHPDGRFVFGNQDPLVGIDAVLAGNAAFFATVRNTTHKVNRVWIVGTTTIAETDVTYGRLDGKDVTLPTVSIWTVDDAGLITDYQVFADLGPVFA